jgi:hypothetical protein
MNVYGHDNLLLILWRFGWEFVVSHTKFCMFDKFSIHTWSWCAGLNEELSISVH